MAEAAKLCPSTGKAPQLTSSGRNKLYRALNSFVIGVFTVIKTTKLPHDIKHSWPFWLYTFIIDKWANTCTCRISAFCILIWVLSEVTIFCWGKHSSREPLSYAIHTWHLDSRILPPLLNLITFLPVFGISFWLQRSPGPQELHLHHNRCTVVSGCAAGHEASSSMSLMPTQTQRFSSKFTHSTQLYQEFNKEINIPPSCEN